MSTDVARLDTALSLAAAVVRLMREAVAERGWSAADVAYPDSNVGVRRAKKWLSGAEEPLIEDLFHVCQLLQVPLSEVWARAEREVAAARSTVQD